MTRVVALLMLVLCTASCTFVREIRVASRGGQLVIDFPWSFWRMVGLQDREYPCVDRIEVFDAARLLWVLDAGHRSGNCADAAMPITIGQPKTGFNSKSTIPLKPGRYGVAVQSYADARVDFILHRDGSVQNITQWDELMQAPCGAYYGPRCPDGRRSQTQ
jgi:hypothetical protein